MNLELKEGKPSRKILEDIVFKHISELVDPDVVQGPAFGEDAGIVRFGDGFLVSHTDPITTASKFAGWLSVHVASNDVAVRGARPRWLLTTILLKPGSSTRDLEEIVVQMKNAAREIDTVFIGGHTEVTPGIPHTIIVTTAIGYTSKRVIKTGDARPGDKVVIIGPVGGEGASIIAWDFEEKLVEKGVPKDVINKAKDYIWRVSVVNKALLIRDYVSSMHDPTEGGVLEGLLEVAIASNNTIRVYLDQVLIDEVIEEVVKPFNIDPLRILSSGSLIATVPENKVMDVISILEEKKIQYSICGEVLKGEPVVELIGRDKEKNVVKETIVDEIYKLWV